MTQILVFSKDRPMQLHAYLESLLFFSNTDIKKISVLYCHGDNISYEKVIKQFQEVNWILETNFYNQILEWLEKCTDEYIMFGCDDVVFKDFFEFNRAEELLKENEEVFGFSLRLGKNLSEFPCNIKKSKNCAIWRWNEKRRGNFYYPWELDCTIYRKKDVIRILSGQSGIKNPNYLEDYVALQPQKYIKRQYLACFCENSKAIVITVNRVQNTHCNAVDDTLSTDPETLSYLYNSQDYRLDINKIAKKKNIAVHVGSKYFILNKKVFKKKIFYKRRKQVKNLLKNLIYLSHFDMRVNALDNIVLSQEFEIKEKLENLIKPCIMNSEESIALLEKEPKSFCRVGDGELEIISGNSIPFQEYSNELHGYLVKILRGEYKNIYVGLPFFYFNPTDNLTVTVHSFLRSFGRKYRDVILKLYNQNVTYIDTVITQLYQTYMEYDFSNYFLRLEELYSDKNILLIIGEGIWKSYKYNLFNKAKSLKIIEAPKTNAFSKKEELVRKAMEVEKDYLICIVLGPAAKALTVELTDAGYMVWDIGHMLKDYNYYKEGKPRTADSIPQFYLPD